MSKCSNCGREIGDTAGPCIQCTRDSKKNRKDPGLSISKICPRCAGTKITRVSSSLSLCEDCHRMI